MIAFQEHLGATARTHDLAANVLKTGFLIVRAHEQHDEAGKQ
jgi:hypothetical protein